MWVSQPGGLHALIITTFGTQRLGLGMTILVNVAGNLAILTCSLAKCKKFCRLQCNCSHTKDHKLLMPQVYRNMLTRPEKEHWLKQMRLLSSTAKHGSIWQYFLIFHCMEFASMLVFSWLDPSLHITILCKLFWRYCFSVCRPYWTANRIFLPEILNVAVLSIWLLDSYCWLSWV